MSQTAVKPARPIANQPSNGHPGAVPRGAGKSPDPARIIRDIAEAVMRDILPDTCKQLADDIEARLRAEYAGCELGYIAPVSARARAAIADAVRASFNGRNAREVAREYGISRASVYRYLKTAGRR